MEISITEAKNPTERSYEIRKLQTLFDDVSFSAVLPKKYALTLGWKKGDFVKVQQHDSKIIVEKV